MARRGRADALLLTPGAGGNRDSRILVALEEALDLPVRRVDFPYRKEGRKAPDRAPKLIASLVDEAAAFVDDLGIAPERLALGGRSMGGRIGSMAVAEGLPAAALVLLSYPLHPPGKPDKLRIEHFGAIAVPTLFCNGDRDPFGAPAELERHVGAIPGPVEMHWLEGQRHDPKDTVDEEIVETVAAFLAG